MHVPSWWYISATTHAVDTVNCVNDLIPVYVLHNTFCTNNPQTQYSARRWCCGSQHHSIGFLNVGRRGEDSKGTKAPSTLMALCKFYRRVACGRVDLFNGWARQFDRSRWFARDWRRFVTVSTDYAVGTLRIRLITVRGANKLANCTGGAADVPVPMHLPRASGVQMGWTVADICLICGLCSAPGCMIYTQDQDLQVVVLYRSAPSCCKLVNGRGSVRKCGVNMAVLIVQGGSKLTKGFELLITFLL